MSIDMKLVIAAAFAEMAKKKSVDKITVKDLVEYCGISRQTFYYHFQDMLEVMEWSIRELLQKALQNSFQAATQREAIGAFIGVVMEYGDVLLRLLSSQRRTQLEKIFIETMSVCISQSMAKFMPNLTVKQSDMALMLQFYACGMAGVLLSVCQDPNVDPQKLAKQLDEILSGKIILN